MIKYNDKETCMKIVVIDGQGGSIGASLISKIKKNNIEALVYGLGTNYFSSKAMKKAGADVIATGENAIVVNTKDADFIMGTTGIVISDSLHGEISKKISRAIGKAKATRILIPFDCCRTYIVTKEKASIEELLDSAVTKLVYEMAKEKGPCDSPDICK
ncbi:hypothetical protein HMPREF3200_00223 [Anaerococcus tetradius]|jgi:hypothetical protein|uniref:DUF3842 family protein n=2 Tax=Anaerococcus tetradius TaxID=33036 RepID=A0A133KI00_9FIRM|nr:hypothetical protein HMPREF3200_00223 [Anaerococcus tetradius]